MIIIDLNNLDSNLIESVKSNDLHRCFNIGAIMKNRRNEKKLTLQKLCKGICCIAYQSRLERNQYDNLNDEIIPKLCERLDLDYEEVKQSANTSELELALHDFMLGDKVELLKRFEKCKEKGYFSTNNLISCMIYLIDRQYALFNEDISRLDTLKSTMSVLELSTLLLVMIYYYIDTYQYEKAKNYYMFAHDLQCTNEDIKIMLKEVKLIIDCNLFSKVNDNRELINYDFQEIKKSYVFGYPISKQVSLQLEYLKTCESDHALKIFKTLEKDPNIVKEEKFYYTKAYVLTKCRKYREVLDYTNSLNTLTYKYVSLYAYSLKELAFNYPNQLKEEDMLKYKEVLKKYIHETKISNEDTIHIAFIKLMEMEIDGGSDLSIFNYIKNEMFALFKTFRENLYFEYCLEKIYGLISKLSKYKEAYEILNYLYFQNS